MPVHRPIRVLLGLLVAVVAALPACKKRGAAASERRQGAPPAMSTSSGGAGMRASKRAPQPAGGELVVRFFAAGHGDAALLSLPGGKHVLIDAGRGHTKQGDNLAKRRLVPFFKSRRIARLDAFIVSHPHFDHYGDPRSLRRAVAFDRIYTNPDGAKRMPALLGTRVPGVSFPALAAGKKMRFGRLELEVLHPPRWTRWPVKLRGDAGAWLNNRSLVIRATFGQVRFLFTGDLQVTGELYLLARALPGRADVLKIGHHGRKSTTPGWLDQIKPRYAVGTWGDRWNREYDQIPAHLFQRLAARKVTLLRGDRDGDIEFRTDGRHLSVKTYPQLVHVPAWKRKGPKR